MLTVKILINKCTKNNRMCPGSLVGYSKPLALRAALWKRDSSFGVFKADPGTTDDSYREGDFNRI